MGRCPSHSSQVAPKYRAPLTYASSIPSSNSPAVTLSRRSIEPVWHRSLVHRLAMRPQCRLRSRLAYAFTLLAMFSIHFGLPSPALSEPSSREPGLFRGTLAASHIYFRTGDGSASHYLRLVPEGYYRWSISSFARSFARFSLPIALVLVQSARIIGTSISLGDPEVEFGAILSYEDVRITLATKYVYPLGPWSRYHANPWTALIGSGYHDFGVRVELARLMDPVAIRGQIAAVIGYRQERFGSLIHPRQFTLDAGYAEALNEHIAVQVGLSSTFLIFPPVAQPPGQLTWSFGQTAHLALVWANDQSATAVRIEHDFAGEGSVPALTVSHSYGVHVGVSDETHRPGDTVAR